MVDFIGDPQWGDPARGRVLVEAAEWSERQALESTLRRAGYATACCPGPTGADGRCPLASGHDCVAAREADVVVHALRPSDQRNREALLALRRERTTAVIVEVAEPVVRARPDDYEGVTVVPYPMSATELLDAVEEVWP